MLKRQRTELYVRIVGPCVDELALVVDLEEYSGETYVRLNRNASGLTTVLLSSGIHRGGHWGILKTSLAALKAEIANGWMPDDEWPTLEDTA